MIAHNSLHRSGRAALAHPAPPLGNDVYSPEGIGVADVGWRKPLGHQPVHAFPIQPLSLTATPKREVRVAADLKSKVADGCAVGWHAIVADKSDDHRAKPPSLFGYQRMHLFSIGLGSVRSSDGFRSVSPWVPHCSLAYPPQRALHPFPALNPAGVLLRRVSLGRKASLHLLRCRWQSGFARRLRGYSPSVRLPLPVHHRGAPFGFPTGPWFAPRASTHDSSPVWVANPSPCGTFIRKQRAGLSRRTRRLQ